MNMRCYRWIAAVIVLQVGIDGARGDDWPHWMGPHRDNVWSETGIISKFPAGGPKVLWRTPIARGYSGQIATVVGQRRRRTKGCGVSSDQRAFRLKALTAQIM